MPTVSEFLMERLRNAGIKDVFGLAGDYCIKFFSDLSRSKNIRAIPMQTEDSAGHAADAYARMNGMGCVCVTYCVGGFKLLSAIACAWSFAFVSR